MEVIDAKPNHNNLFFDLDNMKNKKSKEKQV